MLDLSDLALRFKLRLASGTGWPKQIQDWYDSATDPGREEPLRFLTEVLAQLFKESHIDSVSPAFLRYLRTSVDNTTAPTNELDEYINTLIGPRLLPYSDFKARVKNLTKTPNPLVSLEETNSESRVRKSKTIKQVIEDASVGMEPARKDSEDSGVGLVKKDVPPEK